MSRNVLRTLRTGRWWTSRRHSSFKCECSTLLHVLLFSLLAPSINNSLGPRLALLLGGSAYAGSLLNYNINSTSWLVIFCGGLLGIGYSILIEVPLYCGRRKGQSRYLISKASRDTLFPRSGSCSTLEVCLAVSFRSFQTSTATAGQSITERTLPSSQSCSSVRFSL
jgi:Ion channel regulatory protein UNC-93